jgi:hypothetical protein
VTADGTARVIGSRLIAGDRDLHDNIGAAARSGEGGERPEFGAVEFLHTPTGLMIPSGRQMTAATKQPSEKRNYFGRLP